MGMWAGCLDTGARTRGAGGSGLRTFPRLVLGIRGVSRHDMGDPVSLTFFPRPVRENKERGEEIKKKT